MPPTGKKDLTIDFSVATGGVNTNDPHLAIKNNQAYKGTKNIRFKKQGYAVARGCVGLSSSPTFSFRCLGLDIYQRTAGGDTLVSYANGNVYSIGKNDNVSTLLYNITGSGECWGVSYYDKLFVVNGSSNGVIEGTTGYPIGIAPPSGVVAAASSGGSLADGVYTLYACYARVVSGVNVLYSVGESLGSVTLGSGNNTVAISSFVNSSDARVSNKVIFMSDANGGDYYIYYETNDNTTTSFNIVSTAQRDVTQVYRTVAAPSQQPPTLTGLFGHDDRLFGWSGNTLYASMQAITVYDLERWPGVQYEFPFQIIGLFSIGADLYIMSENAGTFKLPGGDMLAQYQQVSKRLWFRYPRTVRNIDENFKEVSSPVIGVTNDGVRIFDGVNFSPDLSRDIKNEITDLYAGSSSTFQPCGVVQRSGDRTEYLLSYRDLDINSTHNNWTYALNLDTLSIVSAVEYTAAWEPKSIGFQYACVDYTGETFFAQSRAANTQIFNESATTPQDSYVYNETTFLTEATNKVVKLITKMVLPDIAGRIRLSQARYISYLKSLGTITIYIGDNQSLYEQQDIEQGDSSSRWGSMVWGVSRWSSEQPVIGVGYLKENLKGVAVYVVLDISSSDIDDFLSELKLFGEYEQGYYQ